MVAQRLMGIVVLYRQREAVAAGDGTPFPRLPWARTGPTEEEARKEGEQETLFEFAPPPLCKVPGKSLPAPRGQRRGRRDYSPHRAGGEVV